MSEKDALQVVRSNIQREIGRVHALLLTAPAQEVPIIQELANKLIEAELVLDEFFGSK